MPAKKGPARKQPRGKTTSRSIRFSSEEWADVQRKALLWGMTPSAAIRAAVLAWARPIHGERGH